MSNNSLSLLCGHLLISGLVFTGCFDFDTVDKETEKIGDTGSTKDTTPPDIDSDSEIDGGDGDGGVDTAPDCSNAECSLEPDGCCPVGCKSCEDADCDECNSGPCCDKTRCTFHTASRICDTWTDYRCHGEGCGADVQHFPATQYCSGTSSECDGDVVGNWATFQDCGTGSLCVSEDTSSATCTPCAHNCNSDTGACYPDCDPGSDPCCEADGRKIAWHDTTTGLCWQNPYNKTKRNWTNAKTYCSGLGSGWHVPSINELRSLVRGCNTMEWDYVGNSCTSADPCCEVTDSCTNSSTCCLPETNCGNSTYERCSPDPANCEQTSGCLWPAEMQGGCENYFWTSKPVDGSSHVWCVDFDLNAKWKIFSHDRQWSRGVLCVRDN